MCLCEGRAAGRFTHVASPPEAEHWRLGRGSAVFHLPLAGFSPRDELPLLHSLPLFYFLWWNYASWLL